MAIVIEEEKKRSGLSGVIGWVIIVVIVAAAVYYIFFAAPELVIITPTDNLSTIAPIIQAPLNAQTISQSPAFRALMPSPVPGVTTSTGSGGRQNPFIAP